MKTCKHCKTSFKPKYKKQIFCTVGCYLNYHEDNKIEKICRCCKKTFKVIPSKSDAIFCSKKCFYETIKVEKYAPAKVGQKVKVRYKKYKIICLNCKIEFNAKTETRKYCSRDCFFDATRIKRHKRYNFEPKLPPAPTTRVTCTFCKESYSIKTKQYELNSSKIFFCDDDCKKKYKIQMQIKIPCPICGKLFAPVQNHKTCSRKCGNVLISKSNTKSKRCNRS